MKPSLKMLATGCSVLVLAAMWSAGASAQYYSRDDYDRRYDHRYENDRRSYERREVERSYDRGYERGRRDEGYDRGRGRSDGYGYGGYRQSPAERYYGNPVNRMSVEDQKRALKNHRDAQKKALKRGYVID